jgi:hypothetical protein
VCDGKTHGFNGPDGPTKLKEVQKVAKIQVGRDGDLGMVAFPSEMPLPIQVTEAPVEAIYFETAEQFQMAKRQFLVEKALSKLTSEEVALLKEAFSVPTS